MGKFLALRSEAGAAGISPRQMMDILQDMLLRSARSFFGMSEEQVSAIVEKVNRMGL